MAIDPNAPNMYCEHCGALLHKKDLNRGDCWKCGESIIIQGSDDNDQLDHQDSTTDVEANKPTPLGGLPPPVWLAAEVPWKLKMQQFLRYFLTLLVVGIVVSVNSYILAANNVPAAGSIIAGSFIVFYLLVKNKARILYRSERQLAFILLMSFLWMSMGFLNQARNYVERHSLESYDLDLLTIGWEAQSSTFLVIFFFFNFIYLKYAKPGREL